jgi:hypothetical protein
LDKTVVRVVLVIIHFERLSLKSLLRLRARSVLVTVCRCCVSP